MLVLLCRASSIHQLGDLEPNRGLLVPAAHRGGWRRVCLEREALVYAAGMRLTAAGNESWRCVNSVELKFHTNAAT